MNSRTQQAGWILTSIAIAVIGCSGCSPPEKEIGIIKRGSRTNLFAAMLDGGSYRWWLEFSQTNQESGPFPLTMRIRNNANLPLDVQTTISNKLTIGPANEAVVFSGELGTLVSLHSLQNRINIKSSAKRLDFLIGIEFGDRAPKNPVRIVAFTTP